MCSLMVYLSKQGDRVFPHLLEANDTLILHILLGYLQIQVLQRLSMGISPLHVPMLRNVNSTAGLTSLGMPLDPSAPYPLVWVHC